jgi:hypothetical protein
MHIKSRSKVTFNECILLGDTSRGRIVHTYIEKYSVPLFHDQEVGRSMFVVIFLLCPYSLTHNFFCPLPKWHPDIFYQYYFLCIKACMLFTWP